MDDGLERHHTWRPEGSDANSVPGLRRGNRNDSAGVRRPRHPNHGATQPAEPSPRAFRRRPERSECHEAQHHHAARLRRQCTIGACRHARGCPARHCRRIRPCRRSIFGKPPISAHGCCAPAITQFAIFYEQKTYHTGKTVIRFVRGLNRKTDGAGRALRMWLVTGMRNGGKPQATPIVPYRSSVHLAVGGGENSLATQDRGRPHCGRVPPAKVPPFRAGPGEVPGVPGAASRPVSPSLTISGIPPIAAPITGRRTA